MIATLLDESILLREYRRFKSQRRGRILAAACILCPLMAFWLGSILLAHAPVSPSRAGEVLRIFTGIFAAVVMSASFLMALFQSMQVLRREPWTETLDGLFLTLQESRAVMLSTLFWGMISGAAVTAVVLPVIVLAGAAVGVGPLSFLGFLVLDLAAIAFGAALGTIWFFVNQQTFSVSVTPTRVALNTAAFLAIVGVVGCNAPIWADIILAEAACSLFILCAAAALAVWGARVLLHEARTTLRGSGRRETPASNLFGRSLMALGIGLPAVILGSAAAGILLGTRETAPILILSTPATAASLLWPFSAVLDVFRDQRDPVLWFARAVGLSAFELLIGSGLAVMSCRLYQELRSHPEKTTGFSVDTLAVVGVGRDDWQGFKNPILTRELRTRLRSGDARMFIVIAATLSAAAALAPVITSLGDAINPSAVVAMARDSFLWVSLVQLGIVCMIGPGIGAEVIAAEKEKKTYDMLLASRLSASEILWGKVLGCASLLLLLISPSFPLLALSAYLHGVTVVAAIIMIVVLGLFVMTASVLCVSISALCRTSISGKWTAYLLTGLLAIFTIWVPITLVYPTAWADLLGLYVLIFGNMVALFWFAAQSRVQGPRQEPPSNVLQPADGFTATRVR